MSGRLAGKIAVITGAGSGFGKGTAEVFAREGATVVVVDVNEATAWETVDGIRAAGGQAWARACDVSRADQVQRVIEETQRECRCIDILFNNAGMPMPYTPLEDVDEASWDRLMAINVKGVFLGCRAVIPSMKQQGGGVILNMASTAAVRPRPGLTAYNATKGAVLVLTRSLALELAPYKIRVNAINPVAGDTPMLAGFIGSQDPATVAAGKKRFQESVPLGRLATPDDIAYAALFLCSDEASLITGVGLDVDGGRDV
jgi:3-oxoacyl-[acyl-carrier protein] reductase